LRVLAAAVLTLAAGSGCAGGAAGAAGGAPQLPPTPPPAPAAVDFVTGMIHHHGQAIVMANLAAPNAASQTIQTLSQRIIISQTDEIQLMQMWLRDHGLPAPEPDPRGMRMEMGGMEHHMLMPGMISEEQIQQLRRARGAEFDRLMLTFMIEHHQGAIQMVDTLFNSYGGTSDDNIYKLASDIYADQLAEIDRMSRMLEAMPR
jgi:uncharacterized protein (DUF305 family)